METILVVDDDPAVRTGIRQLLEQGGYRVLTARDPSDALEAAEQHPGPIHLLLADVVMADMTGAALADRIHLRRPDVNVLLMSAVAPEVLITAGILTPGTRVIAKPFAAPEFRLMIRETCGQPSPFARPQRPEAVKSAAARQLVA